MTGGAPDAGWFPEVSPREMEFLVTHCADLTFRLSAAHTVSALFCTSIAKRVRVEHWIGMHLASIVAQDSAGKLDALLGDNAASPDCEGNWRHLNFLLLNGETIPLLLKYFELEDSGRCVRLLCARDLSRQLQIHKLLQDELMRLERDREVLFSGR